MIFETATVDSRHNEHLIWVETKIKTSCGSCQHNQQCGTGVIARTFTPKSNKVLVECDFDVEAGQTITVQINERNLISAAFLLYGLPLLMAFLVLLLLQLIQLSEGWQILSTILAGAAGFGLAAKFSASLNASAKAVQSVGVKTFNCTELD